MAGGLVSFLQTSLKETRQGGEHAREASAGAVQVRGASASIEAGISGSLPVADCGAHGVVGLGTLMEGVDSGGTEATNSGYSDDAAAGETNSLTCWRLRSRIGTPSATSTVLSYCSTTVHSLAGSLYPSWSITQLTACRSDKAFTPRC